MKTNDTPLLSVIVTVYGTEEVLPRCIESVLNCTYPRLQLVVVDDNSPGNAREIVETYQSLDDRVKFVQHNSNKGLFLARITGVENSDGDYIAFLDSADHVSVDFYRRAIEKATKTDSDMVIGEVYLEDEHRYSYFNVSHTRVKDIDLYGDDATALLFDQAGKDFTLHVVWNKVYRRDLWNRCYPYLKQQDKHLIMCEDVLYSALFFYFSKHLTNIHGDFIYYVQSKNSSCGLNGNYLKYKKNINDLFHVFEYLRNIFFTQLHETRYKNQITQWMFLLVQCWMKNIEMSHLPVWRKRELSKILRIGSSCCDSFQDEKNFSFNLNGIDFFYKSVTYQEHIRNEELKEKIINPDIEVISFDIFDTLVYRPFWSPTDLFKLLGIYVNDILGTKDIISFSTLRIEAENRARIIHKEEHPNGEEICLDDIYHELQHYLNIDESVLRKIKNREIELEYKYCLPRAYAKELFELAKSLDKKIVIVSDMYLPRNVIEKILSNCGYTGYAKLYLSSEEDVTKATGNLFLHVQKELGVSGSGILHIGDNLNSDVKMAKKAGWQSYHFPKAVDRFMNCIPGLYGGDSYRILFEGPFALRDGYQFNRYWGWRTLLAVVANRIFSNPYLEFKEDTDFNADPSILGYYALGMHMFAVTKWLADSVEEEKYQNLNFMARDGYLPMECFKIMDKVYRSDVKMHYIYLTRSVVIPLQVNNPYDLYGLLTNINIFNQSPKTILAMLDSVLLNEINENPERYCKDNGFAYEVKFSSVTSFFAFIQKLQEKGIDVDKLHQYVKKIELYLSDAFTGSTATFDVGYSCRVESVLKNTFHFDVSPYYLHINNDIPFYRSLKNDIKVHTFYAYSPGVTGVLRELLISALEPSCKSLEIKDGKIAPVFKEYNPEYIETYIITAIQDSAMSFVKDVVSIFDDDIRYLSYQKGDVSLPLEYFLSSAKMADRRIFAYGEFEDDLGLGGKISTFDYWNGQIENISRGINGVNDLSLHWIDSKWKRAICLYFMNRDYLKCKIKIRFSNHPVFLSILRNGYKGLRSIYRLTRR